MIDLPMARTTPTNTSPDPSAPHVLSMGAGVDSVAVLVGCVRAGIRLDMIVFADTGAEKPETYTLLELLDTYLASVGYPRVTRVCYETATASYSNLEGNCLHNDTLPSLAMNKHSCSLKWKIEAIDTHLKTWAPALEAIKAGKKVVRIVGYDAGCADTKRFLKASKLDARAKNSPFAMWYPLRDWGWERPRCEAEIAAEPALATLCEKLLGQPFPFKSACFFCPASKPEEVEWLARTHPDLALRAVVMEYRAATGKHGLAKIQGLGLGREPGAPKGTRNWNWGRFLVAKGLLPAYWWDAAVAAGYLPADWDDYAVRTKAMQERMRAAKAELAAAYRALPVTFQAAAGAANSARKLEQLVRPLEGGDTWPVISRWLAAREQLEAVKADRKTMRSPDWAAQGRKTKDVAKAKAKRAANKEWRRLTAA